MGAYPAPSTVRLGDGRGDLLVGEVGVLGVLGPRDLLPGHRELDLVHADVDQLSHNSAHAFGAIGELGDALDQSTSGDGDLRSVGEISRAGESTGSDGVAADDVQTVIGGRGAQAHGVARVEIGPRRLEGEQEVLLHRERSETVQVCTVVPREVRVGVAQPGHQRSAASVDGACALRGRVDVPDLTDPSVRHQDVAPVWLCTSGIDDVDVPEVDGVAGRTHDCSSLSVQVGMVVGQDVWGDLST